MKEGGGLGLRQMQMDANARPGPKHEPTWAGAQNTGSETGCLQWP